MTKYTDTLNIRLSKYFASLIFVGKGRRRKFFNGEKFPIYGTFYYEQCPLFHVVFSSVSCLKNFILAIGEVKSALEPKLQSLLSSILNTPSAQQLTVKVHLDLFLVSPNCQLTKGAEVHLVTAENCSDFVTRWKDSKLFDFESLYQEEGMYPPF